MSFCLRMSAGFTGGLDLVDGLNKEEVSLGSDLKMEEVCPDADDEEGPRPLCDPPPNKLWSGRLLCRERQIRKRNGRIGAKTTRLRWIIMGIRKL